MKECCFEVGTVYNFIIQLTTYKAESTEHVSYILLQQKELVNPPLDCCEIVIWWIAFISDGVIKHCHVRKKAGLIKFSNAHRRIDICSDTLESTR